MNYYLAYTRASSLQLSSLSRFTVSLKFHLDAIPSFKERDGCWTSRTSLLRFPSWDFVIFLVSEGFPFYNMTLFSTAKSALCWEEMNKRSVEGELRSMWTWSRSYFIISFLPCYTVEHKEICYSNITHLINFHSYPSPAENREATS